MLLKTTPQFPFYLAEYCYPVSGFSGRTSVLRPRASGRLPPGARRAERTFILAPAGGRLFHPHPGGASCAGQCRPGEGVALGKASCSVLVCFSASCPGSSFPDILRRIEVPAAGSSRRAAVGLYFANSGLPTTCRPAVGRLPSSRTRRCPRGGGCPAGGCPLQ